MPRKGVELSWHDAEVSFLEGVLARGGREVADVDRGRVARRRASSTRGPSEFDLRRWLDAFAAAGVDADGGRDRERGRDDAAAVGPHLGGRVARVPVARARAGAAPARRRRTAAFGGCTGCGVCGDLGVDVVLGGWRRGWRDVPAARRATARPAGCGASRTSRSRARCERCGPPCGPALRRHAGVQPADEGGVRPGAARGDGGGARVLRRVARRATLPGSEALARAGAALRPTTWRRSRRATSPEAEPSLAAALTHRRLRGRWSTGTGVAGERMPRRCRASSRRGSADGRAQGQDQGFRPGARCSRRSRVSRRRRTERRGVELTVRIGPEGSLRPEALVAAALRASASPDGVASRDAHRRPCSSKGRALGASDCDGESIAVADVSPRDAHLARLERDARRRARGPRARRVLHRARPSAASWATSTSARCQGRPARACRRPSSTSAWRRTRSSTSTRSSRPRASRTCRGATSSRCSGRVSRSWCRSSRTRWARRALASPPTSRCPAASSCSCRSRSSSACRKQAARRRARPAARASSSGIVPAGRRASSCARSPRARRERDLASDLEFLLRLWKRVQHQATRGARPRGRLHRDGPRAALRARRLLARTSGASSSTTRRRYDKVVVVPEEDARPSSCARVQLYRERVPLFDDYGLQPTDRLGARADGRRCRQRRLHRHRQDRGADRHRREHRASSSASKNLEDTILAHEPRGGRRGRAAAAAARHRRHHRHRLHRHGGRSSTATQVFEPALNEALERDRTKTRVTRDLAASGSSR